MIRCEELFDVFERNEITFFTGVPDSTFKDWMKYLAANHGKKLTNIASCNECEAVALAAGYHLATGKIGVVYMQNSDFSLRSGSLFDPHAHDDRLAGGAWESR